MSIDLDVLEGLARTVTSAPTEWDAARAYRDMQDALSAQGVLSLIAAARERDGLRAERDELEAVIINASNGHHPVGAPFPGQAEPDDLTDSLAEFVLAKRRARQSIAPNAGEPK